MASTGNRDIFVIIGLIALLFLFASTSGVSTNTPTNPQSPQNATITPPTTDSNAEGTVDSGNITNEKPFEIDERFSRIENEQEAIEEALRAEIVGGYSPYHGMVTLSRGRATAPEADNEYVQIRISSSADTPIRISNWRIESVLYGRSVRIGEASYLPRLGRRTPTQPIEVTPGSDVFITTGDSPLGFSFRENICTGYFTQFNRFTPSLRRQCPRPIDEVPKSAFVPPNRFSNECLSYIERIPQCRIVTDPLPQRTESACRSFITDSINYNSCVDRHKDKDDFYQNRWFVYLKRDQELWAQDREVIFLVDDRRRLVDVIAY